MTIESYHQPCNLQETISLLASSANAKILAGGTDLMSQLHRDKHIEQLRLRKPKSWMLQSIQLIDISQLTELNKIEIDDGFCSIGAFVTHDELSQNTWLTKCIPFLSEAANQVGSQQIRNQGTVGGNICNASPCADTVPPLVCLNAEIVLQSHSGKRKLPLLSFFVDAQKTVIRKNEILTEIKFKIPEGKTIQFFKKLGQRKGVAIAKLNLAFFTNYENNRFKNVRIALGAVGPTVLMAKKTAELFEGQKFSQKLLNKAKQACCSEANPIDDIRSSREYRTAMIGELLEIGLMEFFDRQND